MAEISQGIDQELYLDRCNLYHQLKSQNELLYMQNTVKHLIPESISAVVAAAAIHTTHNSNTHTHTNNNSNISSNSDSKRRGQRLIGPNSNNSSEDLQQKNAILVVKLQEVCICVILLYIV